MTRHVAITLGIGLLVSATVLLLADAGVFAGGEAWLRAHYESERLLKQPGSANDGAWLVGSVVGASLLLAWVASDAIARGVKLAFLAGALAVLGVLSLTLVVYGHLFDPVPSMLAAALACVTGLLLSETPAARARRQWAQWLGDRAAPATVAGFAAAEPEANPAAALPEIAVVACRVIEPLPAAAQAEAHLSAVRHLVEEATRFLLRQPGAVLDVPVPDGARVFLGLTGPDAGAALRTAAEVALGLERHLREESALLAAAGRPAPAIGIGLSAGVAATGLHGPEGAPHFGVFGPPVEQARQLASLNSRHRTRILAGRRAEQLGREAFAFRSLDGEAVHELLAAKSGAAHEDSLVGAGDLDLHEPPSEPRSAQG